jgi:hypothetical protein
VTVGSGRTEVRLDLAPRGRDWLLLIGGGEAHVGAVAVAWPDGISLVTVPGHKEGPLAEKCALAVSRASGVVCTAVAGIHQDRATRAEIQDILTNVDRGLGEILAEAFSGFPFGKWGRVMTGREDLRTLEENLLAWADECGQMARGHFRRTGGLRFKHGREAVTEADLAIEEMLRRKIAAAYPDDCVVGEEMGGDGSAATGRVWQIDPIDGTLNFALGLPGFCTSLAVLEGEEIIAACVHQPLVGDFYSAVAGGGARLNGEPMRVSGRAILAEAIVSTQFKKGGRFVQQPAPAAGIRPADPEVPAGRRHRPWSCPGWLQAGSMPWWGISGRESISGTWLRDCCSSRRPAGVSPTRTANPTVRVGPIWL